MTTLTIKIPDSKTRDVSSYIKTIGGEIVTGKKRIKADSEEENEVTHERYFGENIRRVIKAFK